MYGIIPQVLFRTVENVDIPENTGHAELVLILKVAAIAPLEYQHGNFILAGLYIWRYIKFGGHMGCLAVPDKCAVDPEIEAGIHSLEIQMLGKAFPVFLQGKLANIQAAGIIMGNIGRIVGKRIAYICILMAIVPLGLPD